MCLLLLLVLVLLLLALSCSSARQPGPSIRLRLGETQALSQKRMKNLLAETETSHPMTV